MRSWYFRILLGAIGASLFFFLLWRVGFTEIREGMESLGWGLLLVFALGGVSHLVKTWAWSWTFAEDLRPTLRQLFRIRLIGEGVSQLSFAGQIFGETARALLLRSFVPTTQGVSSVLIDRGLYTFGGCLVIVLGSLTTLAVFRLPQGTRFTMLLVISGFVGLIASVLYGLKKEWTVLSTFVRGLGRIGIFQSFVEQRLQGVRNVETTIFRFYRESRRDFWFSFGLNMVGHCLSIAEVWLILTLLGLRPSLLQAFMVESLTKLVNFLGLVIPGNLGAYEAGNVLIVQLIGHTAAQGFILGLARRIRGLAWTAVGITWFYGSGGIISQRETPDERSP